jgi:hypothetical protein
MADDKVKKVDITEEHICDVAKELGDDGSKTLDYVAQKHPELKDELQKYMEFITLGSKSNAGLGVGVKNPTLETYTFDKTAINDLASINRKDMNNLGFSTLFQAMGDGTLPDDQLKYVCGIPQKQTTDRSRK